MARPATIQTGREWSIVFDGEFEGDYSFQQFLVPFPENPAQDIRNPLFELYWGYSQISLIASIVQYRTGGTTAYNNLDIALDIGDGSPVSDSQTSGAYTNAATLPDIDLFIPQTGSWRIAFTAEEWLYAYDLGDEFPTWVDADGFPTYEQLDAQVLSAYADGIKGIGGRYFLRFKPGTDIVIEATSGDVTASVTKTVPALYYLEVPFGILPYLRYAAQDVGAPSTSRITARFQGQAMTADYTRSGNYIEASAADAQGGVRIECAPNDPTGTNHFGEIEAMLYPPVEYDIRTAGFWFEQAARVLPDVRWTPKLGEEATFRLGSGSSTIQRRWSCSSVLEGQTQSPSALNEAYPVRAWLDPDSLSEQGEDTRDWRLQFRGKSLDAATFGSAGPEIDEGDPANWTAGANTTKGGTTTVTLAASGGTGSATRAFSPEKIVETWRYLKVRIRSTVNADVALTLSMHGEDWDLSTGAANAWVEREIDLTCSQSETDDVEPRDSRFPIDGPADPTADLTSDPYSMGWGVDWIDSIQVSGIPDGETIEIDWIRVYNPPDTEHYLGFLSPFYKRVTGWTSPSDTTYLMPYGYWWINGRFTDIGVHAAFVDANVGADTYAWYSVDDLITWMGYTGMSATPESISDDGYHNLDLEAMHLAGNGATYSWTSSRWQNWSREVADNTVPLQGLFDVLEGYPGIGKGCFDGSAHSMTAQAMPLRAAKHLRGRWEGVVFDSDGMARSAQLVSTDPDGGSASTDSLGVYTTGRSYGLGNDSYDVEAGGLSQTDTQTNRWTNRTGFRFAIDQGGDAVSYDVADSWRHVVAKTQSGVVVIERYDNRIAGADQTVTAIAADALCVRYDQGSAKLILWYADGGTVYRRESDDEGRNWSVSTSIGTGTQVAAIVGRSGLEYVYRTNGTTVKGKIYDRAGSLVGSEFDARTGVDDGSPIAVDESVAASGEWRVVLWALVGGTLTKYTSLDGKTFS